MKITTGALEVLHSGIVRSDIDKSLKFEFEDIYIEFIFSECSHDSTIQPSTKTRLSDDGRGLIIEHHGYYGPLGHGWGRAVEVGNFQERTLYMSFFTRGLGPKHNAYSVEYTFYLGESIHRKEEEQGDGY
ncbi:TPA: DUF6864 domain-containing function [Vibrio fluvialis]